MKISFIEEEKTDYIKIFYAAYLLIRYLMSQTEPDSALKVLKIFKAASPALKLLA